MNHYQLKCCDRELSLFGEPVLMGILNVTYDSFSDGGQFINPATAVEHALQMVQEGAGIIDIGGESTRPGSLPVPPEEQIARTIPVIKGIAAQSEVLISIDTTSRQVASAAIEAGAHIINDISALRFDPELAKLAAKTGAAVVLMHMQGTPQTMQKNPAYADVVREVKDFLRERIDFAAAMGVCRDRIIADPGIGFGKTTGHNLMLLKHINEFCDLGVPLLVGPSRKAFIGNLLDLSNPAERLFGTAAACAFAVAAGVHILRVHDIKPMAQIAKITAAIRSAQ